MDQHESSPFAARIGAVTGWLSLASVLLFSVIGPQIIAGQRVSGTLEPAAIQAYFRHAALAPFSAGGFITVVFLLPFMLALRQSLTGSDRARFFSTLGLLFATAAIPLYLASNTLQATLVAVATRGGDIVPMFRLWDVLYNSAAYVLEAGYAAAFAIAMRDTREFPRWMPVYGLVVALLQLVNASALFTGIPDMATLVGNLAFMGWFIGASIGLGQLARTARGTSMIGGLQGV